jgi:hypothetical protein
MGVDDFTITAVSCPAPVGLGASVTATTASLSWTETGSSATWDIEAGPAGFAPTGSATISGITIIPQSLTGLTPATSYDFYVRSNCGGLGTSAWVGPYTYATLCGFAAPYTADFEDGGVTIDACWINESASDDFDWSANTGGTASGYTGPSAAFAGDDYIYTESSGQSQGDQAVIYSPVIDLSGLTNPLMTTYYHMYGLGMIPDGAITIDITTTGSTAGPWTTVFTEAGNQGDVWNQAWVSLAPTYTGETAVIFRITGTVGTVSTATFRNDFAIDEFVVEEAPVCIDPIDLTAVATATAADLGWTELGESTTWEIELGLSGFAPTGTATEAGVTANPYNYAGLTPATSYDFYVRSDCGGGTFTGWVGPYTFITPGTCGVFRVDLADSFGDGWNGGTADIYVNGIAVYTGANALAAGPDSYYVAVNINDVVSIDYTAGDWEEENEIYVYDETNTLVASEGLGWVVPVDIGDFTIPTGLVTCAPCPAPTVFDVTGVDITTADLAWINGGSETEWDMEVGAAGFTPTGTATNYGITSNPYTLPGLTGSTDYDVYLRASCGGLGVSSWVGPVSFTTNCPVVSTFPFTEGFETTSTTVQCWTNEAVVGVGDWTLNNGDGYGGIGSANTGTVNAAFVSEGPSNAGNPITKLMSPMFDMTSLINPRLTFSYGQNSWFGDQNELKVYYSDDAGTTWVEIAHYTTENPDWADVTLALPNPSATYYLAFEGINNWGYPNVIDDVTVEETPPCPNVSDVAAANITETTADISWTSNGSETLWDMEVVLEGTTPSGTPTNAGLTSTTFASSGLTSNTGYDVYVRSDCGGGSIGVWIGPYTFNTAGSCGFFTVELYDSWGDGWNGGTLDIYVNGALHVGGVTLLDGFGPEIVSIPMDNEDVLSIDYTSGGWPSENEYDVYDEASVYLVSEGLAGATPGDIGDYTSPTGLISCPACPAPSALSAHGLSDTEALLGWTAGGSETVWDIESGVAGFTPTGTATYYNITTNPYTVTGLTEGTEYEFYVRASCGGLGTSIWVGPYAFAPLPANDECAGAIPLTVSPTGYCTSYETAGNLGATPLIASGTGDPSCSFYDGGDVWFSVLVPFTGNVTISTNYATPTSITDVGVAAYDACGGTEIGCDDDSGPGWMSELELTGLTPGNTVYVRVWQFGNAEVGEFDICAYEPTDQAPSNNFPCAAIPINLGSSLDCNYVFGQNVNATTSTNGSCSVGDGDVWFSATVAPSGVLVLNVDNITIADATMTVHTITDCADDNTWTEIACDDDQGEDFMPYLYLDGTDGITPGQTLYVRVSGYDATNEGTFNICATQGVVWSGATSSSYTTASNWFHGGDPGVPTAAENVIISPNATNPCVVDGVATGSTLWMIAGADLSIAAGQELAIGGDFNMSTSSNNFGDGTFRMNGSAAQVMNTQMGFLDFGELMIDNAAGVTLNQIYTYGGIRISEVLDVNDGDFDITGGLVTLLSDASGTAYLDDWNGASTSGTVTGPLTVERYIASPGYHHISSPVNTPSIIAQYSEYGTASGVDGVGVTPIGSMGAACGDTTLELGSNYGRFFEWQENSPGFNGDGCKLWGWIVRSAGTFENGRGYAAQATASGPFTLRVTGTVNASPVSNAGLTNSGGDGNGFHLVGNPFAAPITWNNPGGFANFAYAWNDGTGTYSSYFSGSQNFAAHQGFFVQSLGNSTFSVDNNDKFEGDPGFLRTGSVFGDYSLQLDVAGNGFSHFSVIAFADVLGGSSCTNGWDAMCDAYALPGNSGQPFIFSMTTEGEIASPNRLQYNTQTLLDGATRSVPVAFNPGANGTFTISATDLESFPSGTGIVLEDTKEGIMHDLNSNPVYTFTSVTSDFDPNNPTSRFVVHFSPASVTDIANVIDINAGFYTMGDQLIMQMNILESVEGMFSVLNAVGQDVMSSDNITTINGKHAEDVGELANGVYIVRFVTEGKTFSGKFVKH